jgi:hypothetical protein
MGTPGGPAHIPSSLVAGIGRGRVGRFRRAAYLEHFNGTAWGAVTRFATIKEANVALDEAVASGIAVGELRVSEVGPSMGTRIALVVGLVALVLLAVAGISLFVVGSS